MSTQDQPRGSRETYERLSDPAMYWTQVNAQPIREPIRHESHEEQQDEYLDLVASQHRPLPEDHPYRELSPEWQGQNEEEETRLAELLPYDETPVYDDRPAAHAEVYDDRPAAQAEVYDDDSRTDRYQIDDYRTDDRRTRRSLADAELEAHERFGGVNWGAGFFGWLVAVGFGVFLAAVLGIVIAVLRRAVPAVSTMLETRPGVAAIALAAGGVAVLMTAYYAGGYVAGRMSRFDGGRQGAGVWFTGLLLTAMALGASLFLGAGLNVLEVVDLPPLPLPADSLGLAGLVGALAALAGSLLAAIGGGKVGCRYHRKVDEYL